MEKLKNKEEILDEIMKGIPKMEKELPITHCPLKLKTLKDLNLRYVNYDYIGHKGFVSIKMLKAEAVKWYHRSDGNKHKFILEFFNLTEEDLK